MRSGHCGCCHAASSAASPARASCANGSPKRAACRTGWWRTATTRWVTWARPWPCCWTIRPRPPRTSRCTPGSSSACCPSPAASRTCAGPWWWTRGARCPSTSACCSTRCLPARCAWVCRSAPCNRRWPPCPVWKSRASRSECSGAWTPTAGFLRDLLSHEELPSDRRQPYPFFLASPLETAPEVLGPPGDWLLEWKWDGIRLQLIRRGGEVALWSRGEERLDGRFPEIEAAAAGLPRDCVMDGELLGWREGEQPLPFTALQTRIQRRKPGPKTLAATPARVLAYDLLE